MKLLPFFSVFIFLAIHSQGQEKKKLFFEEYSISLNKINSFTNYLYIGVDKRTGFGLGCYHSYRNKKPLNLRFGIEFNRLRYFVKYINDGLSGNAENFTYAANFVSLPVGLRYNMGKKTKVFVESGISMEASIGGHRKGTEFRHNFNNPNVVGVVDVNDHKSPLEDGISSYLGFGGVFPFSNFDLILKPEIKCQLGNQRANQYMVYGKLLLGIKLN